MENKTPCNLGCNYSIQPLTSYKPCKFVGCSLSLFTLSKFTHENLIVLVIALFILYLLYNIKQVYIPTEVYLTLQQIRG